MIPKGIIMESAELALRRRYFVLIWRIHTTTNAQSELAARYGAPDISPLQQWNETIDQLLEQASHVKRA